MNDKVLSLDLDNPNRPTQQQDGPVECLGKTFKNDQARRDYYLTILAEKLKDPEFRKIEGFPIGEDEDILNLSDPPYYTACPNPFIADFISFYGHPYDPNEEYKREPYASDVNEGKNDPIYNAHSYHTKVPYKAIMRYILHYTNPGDLVFDGFCGTGMTGVAAQMCANKEEVESLGYRVNEKGEIFQEVVNELNGKSEWQPFSKLGHRYALLNDLSPAGTFIAKSYNASVNIIQLEKKLADILKDFRKENKWMWETYHTDGKTLGKINYIVWSDVYQCTECSGEFVYYEEAFKTDQEKIVFSDEFTCPHCNSLISKSPKKSSSSVKPLRVFISEFDPITNEILRKQKQVPVLINYSIGTKRYQKKPDKNDLNIVLKTTLNYGQTDLSKIPCYKILEGDKSSDPYSSGITYTHQFYTDRVLISLANFLNLINADSILNFVFGSMLPKLTKMNRYMPQHGSRALVGPMANTLYVPAVSVENNVIDQFEFQLKKVLKALNDYSGSIITTQAAQSVDIPSESIDYIFIDPPFGSNIMYSELSYVRESWLHCFTNNKLEAIESKAQRKNIDSYMQLMKSCFEKAYKSLKSGCWMTVEFSNTKASVWNAIQNALTDAGFIVASVAALDKSRGGLHAMLGPTAVKQDLIISAYKPNGGFEDRFVNESNEEGIWDFIRTHLGYLAIVKRDGGELVKVPERDPRILYDQVVAYFVRNMRDVPLSSRAFQDGLLERFSERDGMIFLPEQVAQYDKARMTSSQLRQLNIFVDDEASAIEWLRQLLNDKPQTYQDIHPKFINELSGWKKAEMQLELMKLLEQNFLKFSGQGLVPAQIHSYLSTNFKELRSLEKDDSQLLAKAKDRWFVPDPNNEEQLQALRERDLLKQFEEYKSFSGKKIKLVRLEAVRAGFKKAWQDRDYATIIHVAEKIPDDLLQEDQKLLMWYDQAQTRHSDSSLF
ncbi:DNA methyltransferase [Acinetobacter baumannii]|nr:DNA methylase [Acinetobacter baumannii]